MSFRPTLLAAALALSAAPALAGGLSDPVVEPVITPQTITADATQQSSSIGPEMFVVLSALIAFSAAAAQ